MFTIPIILLLHSSDFSYSRSIDWSPTVIFPCSYRNTRYLQIAWHRGALLLAAEARVSVYLRILFREEGYGSTALCTLGYGSAQLDSVELHFELLGTVAHVLTQWYGSTTLFELLGTVAHIITLGVR